MRVTDFTLNVLASIVGGIVFHLLSYFRQTIKRSLKLAQRVVYQTLRGCTSSILQSRSFAIQFNPIRNPLRLSFVLFLVFGMASITLIRPLRTDREILSKTDTIPNALSTLPLQPTLKNPAQQRRNPFAGRGYEYHEGEGEDIGAAWGTPVEVAASGKVTIAGWQRGYGRVVFVDHGNGVTTRYGYLSQISVNVGQVVKTGDIIGLVGATGRASGPKLHYEVRINNQPIYPQQEQKPHLPFSNRLFQTPNSDSALVAAIRPGGPDRIVSPISADTESSGESLLLAKR